MRILVAEDDLVSRRLLERTLALLGHEPVSVADGRAALEILQQSDAPRLAILDWMMPELDGSEVCRRVRANPTGDQPYLILLTARQQKDDVVEGLESGADDYITKPFHRKELQCRVQTGVRILELQRRLTERVGELELALAQVKELKGLLPICCYCKKIRDDQSYWQQVETYLEAYTAVEFSHGICPDCWRDFVEPDLSRA